MNTIKTKFVVVSLPRTGTKSLCQMAKNVGFEISHAPGNRFETALKHYDFIADTPVFTISNITKLLSTDNDVKFIYCEKPVDSWISSMQKVGLSNNYNDMYDKYFTDKKSLNSHNILDFESLYEVLEGKFDPITAKEKFLKHRRDVINTIPQNRLLFYNFRYAWEPLARFMGVSPPNGLDIPHLNSDTMFDKIA